MKVFDKKITINFFFVIILIVSIAIFFLWSDYFKGSYTLEKKETLLSGLITGLIIALLQLFLSWYEHKEINRFKKMKVLDIRSHRDDRDFYSNLIKNAKNRIDIMGVTASRFVSDFADTQSTRPEKTILFDALTRGVVVRILVPEDGYLLDQKLKDIAKHTKEQFIAINAKSTNFNFRYYNHVATHSIFIIDDICILGPVFPNISSKDTPAIQIRKDSPYAEKYLHYFEDEWTSAT